MKLTCKISLHIPSTMHNHPALPLRDHWLKTASELFAKLFGGFNISTTTGGYWSDELNLTITEEIKIVTAYAATEDDFGQVFELAGEMLESMRQEAVFIELNNSEAVLITKELNAIAA